MIPRRPEDGPYHQRLKCRENTDEALIGQFWLDRGEYRCETYSTTMTREGCADRKALALEMEKGGGLNVYAKCLECKGVEKMDEKKCSVEGCGKKVFARGMCSTHYFRVRGAEKKAAAAGETKAPTPETKPPIPETKAPEPEKRPEPPATPAPQKKPENMHENMQAKKKANGIKRVNVQFAGPDVSLWEQLRDRAKKNRRDIRTEALVIIENGLRPDEPEVYS